ncbi:MAG TPA: hypothetical protein VFZ73_01945 [Gemmatimonadaceae bacterium]
MSNKLAPEEALGGPLYLVAALLVAIPFIDFLLSIPPAEFGNVQWRFSAVGLLSGYTLLPIVGCALAFVVSSVLKHYGLQRILVLFCLTMGVVLITLSLGFLLDVAQVRMTVATGDRAAFSSAWNRALIKHVLGGAALIYMGWRARRMIPARVKQRGPKPVHVISK